MLRAGVLTASTEGARGRRADQSGAIAQSLLEELGHQVVWRELVPDEQGTIEAMLRHAADELRLDLVLTTGGTGLSPRDVTPEATLAVVERQVEGLAEAIRREGWRETERAALSRAVVGVRGRTLIVNLAGSPAAVRSGLHAVGGLLEHAVAIIQDRPTDHSGRTDAPKP